MQPVILDIIKEGRFYKQLKYTKRGFPMLINDKVIETYNSEDIRKFVEGSLPSLVGKDYNIEFAKQRV